MQHQTFGLHKAKLYLYSNKIIENNAEKPIKIELVANIEKLDVELSKNTINFGNILPNDNRILKETFVVKNPTNMIINLKAEIEIESQFNASLNKQEICLRPNSSEELILSIRPTYSVEGSFEGLIALKINSSSVKKTIKIEVNITEPRISVFNDKDNTELFNKCSLSFEDTEIGYKSSLSLKFINISE